MIRINYDHQIFSEQKYGGISRYFIELYKHLHNESVFNINIDSFSSNNAYLNKVDKSIVSFTFTNKIFLRLNYKLNQFYSKYKLQKRDYDLFHPTYYDPYFLDYIDDKPFVLTVHDMIHERYFDNDIVTQNKRILCEKASKIIAVSENTKQDLIKYFTIEASKIEVVYHGNSMKFNGKMENSTLPDKYILFVGKRDGYKNFKTFIQSVVPLLEEDKELTIICAGGGVFTSEEENQFIELKIQNRLFQYDFDDTTLAQYYANALVFVFPSLYEGFGIPILEAFSCKCPLVCSNTSCFPEVAGEGAEYFDPEDEKSIYTSIKKLLDSPVERELLAQKGSLQLQKFSWDRATRETKKIYESVINSN